MVNIAVFASGSGTNAEKLIHHFQTKPDFEVKVILCNNPEAGVLKRAQKLNVDTVIFDKKAFMDKSFINQFKSLNIHAIVLAGFLWKIPDYLIREFENLIINIHPSLLPKYGGKGMYGNHVHEAVINNHEKASGITIHLVNEDYDKGKILFQEKCEVLPHDTPGSLANKIHQLEHEHFPQIVEDYLRQALLKSP